MIQLLPTKVLDWVNPESFNLDNYYIDIPLGCFVEVDLDYPDELHDLRNDYPLEGENIEVKKQMLPDYQLQINNFHLVKTKNVLLI